jgi:hypothetical protein
MPKYFLYITSFLIITLQGCGSSRVIKRKLCVQTYPKNYSTLQRSNSNPPLTVWIHGTRLLRRSIFRDLFKNKPSIKPAIELNPARHLRSVADTLHQNNPAAFPLETFYTFGWSGRLNAQDREYAGQILYHELTKIITEYQKKYGTKPFVRLIAHSHGGNVVFNMVQYAPPDTQLCIDELILLAVPVQAKTKDAIKSSLFKHVDVLYSSLDMVQIIAPQFYPKKNNSKKKYRNSQFKSFPSFSTRRFPPQKGINQIKIKLNNRAITHKEFISQAFLSALYPILETIHAWQREESKLGINNLAYEKMLRVYLRAAKCKS